MAVGISGAVPGALASVCAGVALVALGAARARMAALAAVLLAGLATIPPAQGADALTTVSALQIAEATIQAAEIVCARHLAKDAPPGTEGLLWEPALWTLVLAGYTLVILGTLTRSASQSTGISQIE